MNANTALVITSISSPNAAMRSFADGSQAAGVDFLVVGDSKSPPAFELPGCTYFSIEAQRSTPFFFAQRCPIGHYARKNVGYLLAIARGAELILDTDDDNYPRTDFWAKRSQIVNVPYHVSDDWVNVYRFFSDTLIWPRGLPLDRIHSVTPQYESLSAKTIDCPIQQGLADENPDVDAVYRLILPLPQSFHPGRAVALSANAWVPFNSQNTTWFKPAFPLLYLPAFCSFRMTDIWRSFVAQRIAWVNDWRILFHEATVWQERNAHNLMKDFADEVPGYLGNTNIVETLSKLPLRKGTEHIGANMLMCYEALVEIAAVGREELSLLSLWLDDLGRCEELVQTGSKDLAGK